MVGGGNGSTSVSSSNSFDLYDIQLELGSTATSYEPYLGHLYTVQIGSTVYGGYDEIVSGSGKSAYGIADFGDLTWYYDSANTRFRGEMPSNYKQPTGASDRYQYLYCSCYKPDDSPVTGSHINNTIGGFQGTSYVWVNDSAYTDAGQFKTARTGQKIAYLLSTPTDITHDSTQIETLAGQNNLSCPLSGQSIETNGVEYKELFTFADVKEYVNTHSSSRINYSTEEQDVGMWIDGKPLYQKTYTATITANSQWIDTGLDSTACIVKSDGMLIQNNGDILTLASGDSSASAGINVFSIGVVTPNKWSCLYRTSNNDAKGNISLTLWYTKN
jgi:hypothetical protein